MPPAGAKTIPGLASLVVLLVLSEVIYLALLRFDAVNGARPVLIFLVLMGALFALYTGAYRVVRGMRGDQSRARLLVVAAGAVLFRLTLLPAGLPHDLGWREKLSALRADLGAERVAYERFLLFDDDVWRYLWDGHVWAHGTNPYQYAPADAALDVLADDENVLSTDGRPVWRDIRENIAYAATPTVYPPLAQAVFQLSHAIAPGSVLALKALVVSFDLLAALFIALALKAFGRPAALVLLYAWNPLVVKVFAASGHVDAVVVAALAATTYFLARGPRAATAASFGLAILSKLSPLILLPFVAKRVGWRYSALVGGIVLAGYVPFLGAGAQMFAGLLSFARDWRFNAGPLAFVEWVAGFLSVQAALVARVICGVTTFAWAAYLAWRDDGRGETFAPLGALALGALVILSPTVMPWYVTWVLPLALIANQRVWVGFSAVVCLAFLVMINGTEYAWTLCLEYGLLAALLWQEFWWFAAKDGVGGSSLFAARAVAARKSLGEPELSVRETEPTQYRKD
jgi:hypothetical protein